MQFIVYICNLYAIYCVHMQFIVYVCNLLCTYAIYCVRMQFVVYVCNLLCTHAILLPEKSTKLPFKRSTVITSDDIFVNYKVTLNFRMCRLTQEPSTNQPQRPYVIAGRVRYPSIQAERFT